MVDFKYDFAFLLKMVKYVFLPVLAVVIVTAFIIFIYSRKVKKQDMQKYNYLVDFWTTFLAILIISSLFAVTVGFSMSLSNAIRMYNLVQGHEVIYYLVVCSPIIPLIFLVIYVYRLVIVLLNKPKKEKNQVTEEEIVPAPSVVVEDNKNEEDNELSDPIVVDETYEVEEEQEIVQDKIENREFTPIITPERSSDDSKDIEQEYELETDDEISSEEESNKQEEKMNIEETEEDIELL